MKNVAASRGSAKDKARPNWISESTTAAEFVHHFSCFVVGFGDPFDDAVGFGGIFKLDRDRLIETGVLNLFEILDDGNDAASGWKVAMNFAVAVREVNVFDESLEFFDLSRLDAHEVEVGDIAVGADDVGHVDMLDKFAHGIDGVDE